MGPAFSRLNPPATIYDRCTLASPDDIPACGLPASPDGIAFSAVYRRDFRLMAVEATTDHPRD
jgi:hypothetical protein